MKNSTVSLFESYKQKLPIGQVKLFDWVCSERYKEEAKYIRSLSEKKRTTEVQGRIALYHSEWYIFLL